MFEFSGYVGAEYLGQPSGFAIPNSALRWGVGAGFPSRSPVRVTAELVGHKDIQQYSLDHQRFADWRGRQPTAGQRDGAESDAGDVGITFQAPKGFFAGVGLALSLPEQDRSPLNNDNGNVRAEDWDWQVRIGYHPGVPVYVPPPPPPTPPPPPPAPRRASTRSR